MIKLKYQLATLATAALAVDAYAQPVVPDESQAPTCPTPSSSAQCPQPSATAAPPPAQPLQQPAANPPPPPPPQETYVEHETPWWDQQFAISVGGGVDDFARGDAKRFTNTGGSWNARLTMGAHSYLAGEASYIGSAQTLNMGGVSQTLYGNGAQGALRINILPHLAVTPFAFGGAAWRYYSTSGGEFGNTHEDKFEVPVGGGVAAYVADLMIDVRGEYRFAPWNSNVSGTGVDALSGSFDRWGVTGNIGAVF